ncbi:MAG: ATP-binding protein [Pseudomonadota bacterium]
MHYLKRELYDLIKADDAIFDFLQTSSLDGLWYWDLEQPEHEWMSEGFWQLFGVDPATKAHRASEWQDLIHPDDLKNALDNFHKHLADPNHPYDQIVRYRHAKGHMVTVRCRGLAIRDNTGKAIRLLGAHNDLTALKQHEEKLAASNASLADEVKRANAAVEARSVFLATMSHEIRTPLNAILGLLDLIKSDPQASESTRQRADVGHRAAEQLLIQLVNVIEATRLDADVLNVRIQEVRTQTLVEQWSELLKGSVARHAKPLTTCVMTAPDLPDILHFDSNKVTQIVGNLIDNAAKFTDEGRIEIHIDHNADASHPVGIAVYDSGPGIPVSERKHVFDRFTRLETARSQQKGGSGLGLSICHELATLLGGNLAITDDLPQGFNMGFRLTLPDPG